MVTVVYHSRDWALLVEAGWRTWSVDANGRALMYFYTGFGRYVMR